MAWSDKASDAQVSAWFNLTKWVINRDEAMMASAYLERAITRGEMSKELGRLRSLVMNRKLKMREQVYDSEIWKGYQYD